LKLTLYAVRKINYPCYFHTACLYKLPIDRHCEDEHFELFLDKNSICCCTMVTSASGSLDFRTKIMLCWLWTFTVSLVINFAFKQTSRQR